MASLMNMLAVVSILLLPNEVLGFAPCAFRTRYYGFVSVLTLLCADLIHPVL
jgi:hypothetical protein